ncbi:MAG: PhzF family phenazine biosynthesis protein [Pseudobdellovibrionaceae bacterium]
MGSFLVCYAGDNQMRQFPFYWIDAFASKKLSGNPCAVILDADLLSANEMQAVAKEMNLSETAFVVSPKNADFAARYFTPDEELPFAGHPTIATIHALQQAGLIQKSKQTQKVSLELPAGAISVEIQSISEDSSRVEMKQLAPQFMRTYKPHEVLPIFGLSESDLLPRAVIQTVSTGSPILMVPLKNLEVLKRTKYVDVKGYEELKAHGDFLWPHHFTLKGITKEATTFARSLATPPSTLEDPFTGSATGCMAAYLWKYGFIPSPSFLAQQGHWLGRPGQAEVRVLGSPESIDGVLVAGAAETIVIGKLKF